MKTTKLLVKGIAIIMAVATLQSCHKTWCIEGDGEREEFNVNLDDFDGVDLMIDADVFISEGDDFEVIVDAQENIFDNIDFDIRNGVLEISNHECTWNHKKIDIFITMPHIEYAGIAGSGDITGMDVFDEDEIEFEIRGSGDIDFMVQADKVKSTIMGSGDIELDGYAEDHTIRIDGSGSVDAYELETEDTYITIAGSGDCEVWVLDYLKVDILGSGNVYYYGNPELDISIDGSGDVFSSDKK